MQTLMIHSVAYAQRSLRWIALVAVLLALGGMTNVSRAQATAPSVSALGLSAAELMRPDGTLDLTKGVSAAINLRGWDVTLDPTRGPVLAPQAAVWNPPGQGVDSTVYALMVGGSDVYVGGGFTTATNPDGSPVTVNYVAKYSASTKAPTTTTLASSQNTSIVGQPVTFTNVFSRAPMMTPATIGRSRTYRVATFVIVAVCLRAIPSSARRRGG